MSGIAGKHGIKRSILSMSSGGFTLLEILISIFIFGIVVTTVFGSYRMVFSSAEAIGKNASDYELVRVCLNRMVMDLTDVYVTPYEAYKRPDFDDPPDPYRIVGEPSVEGDKLFARLRFTSFAHLPFHNTKLVGIAEIIYYVQETDSGHYVLRRSDRLYPYSAFEPNESDPVLCRDIQSYSVQFFDAEGETFDRWDSEDDEFGYASPVAVGIQLEIGPSADPLYMETRVSLRMVRKKQS